MNETKERPSMLPIFDIHGVCFRCFVSDAGMRYVWRSIPNADSDIPEAGSTALAVGRIGATTWARSGGKIVGRDYATIRDAMVAAIAARRQMRSAA